MGSCKPKFNCVFLVCSFYDQFSIRHCHSKVDPVRECHGFINPCGLASWVVAGVGAGWVFVTPA